MSWGKMAFACIKDAKHEHCIEAQTDCLVVSQMLPFILFMIF